MLQALRDEIIVKPVFVERKGVLVIPKSALKYKQYDGEVYGEVISIGPKYPYNLKPGDKVIWQRHEGKKIIFEGETYLILKARWVQARKEE